jgi:hypothetical protein
MIITDEHKIRQFIKMIWAEIGAQYDDDEYEPDGDSIYYLDMGGKKLTILTTAINTQKGGTRDCVTNVICDDFCLVFKPAIHHGDVVQRSMLVLSNDQAEELTKFMLMIGD